MRVLFFGDVFGKPGRQILEKCLPSLKSETSSDIVIINGENLADGRGLTEKVVKPLWKLGVDAITSGNHLWDRTDSIDYIRSEPRIVKPINYPKQSPGNPMYTIQKDSFRMNVLCLTGQVFMPPCDSAFTAFDSLLDSHQEQLMPLLIDFHAESTAEKRAFAWFADGKTSAIVGTHTHVQTADEEILPLGTAYITDTGMTGAHDSVIGVKKHIILDKFINSVPNRFETSEKGLMINAVLIDICNTTGIATNIERIRQHVEIC